MSRNFGIGIALFLLVASGSLQAQLTLDGVVYRDPTRPSGATASTGGVVEAPGRRSYEVTFIRSGGQNSVAVINGQMVGAGDMVDGARVRAIESGAVILEVDGDVLEVSTFRATFRTQSNSVE